MVNVGRISTVVLIIFAGLFALVLTNAYQAFEILLSIGAGTGSIFILRWFWWRINAYSEITGMVVSFALALLLNEKIGPESLTSIAGDYKLLLSVGITTISWVAVTLLTKPTDPKTLADFFNLVMPYGKGWNGYKLIAEKKNIYLEDGVGKPSVDILAMFLGIIIVYGALFAVGQFIYGNLGIGAILLVITLVCSFV